MVFLKEHKTYVVIWGQDKTILWVPNNFRQIKSKTAERLQDKDTACAVSLLDKENFSGMCFMSWPLKWLVVLQEWREKKREGPFRVRE